MDNEKSVYFDYIDLNGIKRKSEVLTLFKIDGRNHDYALCSVPNDEGTFDIMPFIVTQTGEQSVRFDDILDQEELSEVIGASNAIIR